VETVGDFSLRDLRFARSDSASADELSVRFETPPPGTHAQGDWASCGRFPDSSDHIIPIYLLKHA
jgi:hypothetical protein